MSVTCQCCQRMAVFMCHSVLCHNVVDVSAVHVVDEYSVKISVRKVVSYSITSIGFRADPSFLAVKLS